VLAVIVSKLPPLAHAQIQRDEFKHVKDKNFSHELYISKRCLSAILIGFDELELGSV